ncbi:MAG: hypothetical protein KDD61_08700 [Bdellovibrionales bacterium]|nr:hypothetical protein [Bdellovibrionales bacterium]
MKNLPFLIRQLFLFLSVVFLARNASGVQIYTFIDEKCDVDQGLIIGAEEDQIELLNLNGHAKTLNQKEIKFILIHDTLENPIKDIQLSSSLNQHLNHIYIKKQKKPLFTGWAVRFIENLVLFYDIRGNSHALELYQISKIRPVEPDIFAKPVRYVPTQLHLGSVGNQCRLKSNDKSLRPTRILADKVQISEVLDNFKTGFADLKSYKERTYLYAKPYLYEKRTRMGIVIGGDLKESVESLPLPFYFQWANGSEYRFQSFNQIGNLDTEYLPTVERNFSFRSDLKSHLFHASFVGNLSSLAAGTEFYTPIKEDWSKVLDEDRNRFSATASSFNYMALMGGDYGPFSLSFGTLFANHLIYVKNPTAPAVDAFREVLASNISPIVRVMFTNTRFKASALISQTTSQSNSPTDFDVSIDENVSSIGTIDSYDFESHFIRLNGDMTLTNEFSIGASQIYKTFKYNETTPSETNFMDATHLTTQVRLKHAFGDYVAIRLYGNYHIIERKFRFASLNSSENDNGFTLGGSFEFVF